LFFLFAFIGLQPVFHQLGIPWGTYRGCTNLYHLPICLTY